LEKLEDFVKREGHCNSAIFHSFLIFLFTDSFFFSEIGELLRAKSKYGPGGEFESDWYALLTFCLRLLSFLLMQDTAWSSSSSATHNNLGGSYVGSTSTIGFDEKLK
jgi:hypothetical protein